MHFGRGGLHGHRGFPLITKQHHRANHRARDLPLRAARPRRGGGADLNRDVGVVVAVVPEQQQITRQDLDVDRAIRGSRLCRKNESARSGDAAENALACLCDLRDRWRAAIVNAQVAADRLGFVQPRHDRADRIGLDHLAVFDRVDRASHAGQVEVGRSVALDGHGLSDEPAQ